MTIKPSKNPYGYKELLVYKKAEVLQSETVKLTGQFPTRKTTLALADQMNRSARSTKQNIVEGWKRNSTKEYYEFLGFAVASNAELEEDCLDIWKGFYPELMEIKGIMGERGEKVEDIDKIPFYPLDFSLPLAVQCRLRCKELNFLLEKLQKSLVSKMSAERTLPLHERQKISENKEREFDKWLDEEIINQGFVKLSD